MEKTVSYDGVQYVVRRRSNLNKQDLRWYMRLAALHYEALAADIGYSVDAVATALVDYVEISAVTQGGTILLTRQDTVEDFLRKCKAWLDGDVAPALGDLLTETVNTVNATQPDRALTPDPLPDNADPKV